MQRLNDIYALISLGFVPNLKNALSDLSRQVLEIYLSIFEY